LAHVGVGHHGADSMTHDLPDDPPDPPAQPVENPLASPDLARAVESDEFKRLLDHTPIAIAVSRRSGGEHRISYVNHAFERLTGLAFAAAEGREWSLLDGFRHEDDPQLPLGTALVQGEDFLGTFAQKTEDDPLVVVQVYVGCVEKEDGSENYRLAALVDVTARERAQREDLERQIRDKDLLLREIQHRVKNNLQLIIGLIRFEARSSRRGEIVDLDRLAGRIESLRLLYDTLATDRGDEVVDLGHYVSQIATAVMRSHGQDHIGLELRVQACPVSINIAMPAGLAVNELLTNAFKYAFAGRDGGVITLECQRDEDGSYRLIVADDGVGLPDGVTWPMPGKLGSLVVQTLRENARMSLDVDSGAAGTRVTLHFVTPMAAPKA
jgi:PAS domain S-box-containing protein